MKAILAKFPLLTFILTAAIVVCCNDATAQEKISFAEFKQGLDKGTIPTEKLGEYLKLDETSPVVRLTFRENALLTPPPPTYDVDKEVYLKQVELEKKQQKELDEEGKKRGLAPKKLALAEGDSWYRLPPFVRPKAIASRIYLDDRYNVRNLAKWGDTLEEIRDQSSEWLEAIETDKPEYFMLCGGGNDLIRGLKIYLHHWDNERPIDQYITDEGKVALNEIEVTLRQLIDQASKVQPSMPIFVHGYDYPRPRMNGRFIGKPMSEMGFELDKMDLVLRPIIDRLNTHIENATKSNDAAHYIDLRRLTPDDEWWDEIHPNNAGFRVHAARFEEEFGRFLASP